MTSPVNALLARLQQVVKADPGLGPALHGEGLSDRKIRATRFPALSLGAVEVRDLSTGDGAVCEILLTLEIWSEAARREAEALATELRRVTEALPPALDGFRLVNLLHRRTVSRREVKTGLFVAEVTFRAVLE